MLVDQIGRLWRCDDRMNKLELIPNALINRDSLISNQLIALTTEGYIINLANGTLSQYGGYKSVHYINKNVKLVVNRQDEGLVISHSTILLIITNIKLVVGTDYNIRILRTDKRWYRLDNRISWSIIEVNELPILDDIIRIKDNLILTNDKIYDLTESQEYSINFKVIDMANYSYGSLIANTSCIVIADNGYVYIGNNGRLELLDNSLVNELNYGSRWKRTLSFHINGESKNLLINELGQVYVITDEYGSIRTTKIPCELYA